MKLIPNLAEIDRKAVQQAGIPAQALMEAAGTRIAEAVQAHCRPTQRGVILCGPGNNGGDGFVCARKLYQAGFHVLMVVHTGTAYKNEALANFEELLVGCPLPVINANEQPDLAITQIESADFMVDALFGSGLSRPVAGIEAQLIEAMNVTRQKPYPPKMVAVDLPSGIDGATGQVLGCAVQADFTVTFAAAKPGLYLYPGKAHAGVVSVVDIGIPTRFLDEDESRVRLITPESAKSWLPVRAPESHKYQHGHVLVIAGSNRMPGAAVLCSEAAMSAGAGLVTLAAPVSVFEQMTLMPELLRLPLSDRDRLASASVAVILDSLSSGKYSTVVIGPGLGNEPVTFDAIHTLLAHLKSLDIPVVIDADGLNALSQAPMELNERFILTPHLGEAARLLHQEKAETQSNLMQTAQDLRARYGAQVVLKSASTVIATVNPDTQDELLWISPTGNPGMATAGSGDILTGLIGAMAAQGKSYWQAAALGVFLHGLAGDAAVEALTTYAMRASDITGHFPQAFKQVISA